MPVGIQNRAPDLLRSRGGLRLHRQLHGQDPQEGALRGLRPCATRARSAPRSARWPSRTSSRWASLRARRSTSLSRRRCRAPTSSTWTTAWATTRSPAASAPTSARRTPSTSTTQDEIVDPRGGGGRRRHRSRRLRSHRDRRVRLHPLPRTSSPRWSSSA